MRMLLLVEVEVVVGKKIRPYLIKSECCVQVVRNCMMFDEIVEREEKSVVCAKDKKSI
jgi:hypothetical protein